MAVVSCFALLKKADERGVALPAFNIDNMESALAVFNAVKKLKEEVIIQTIPKTLSYGGVATYPAMIRAMFDKLDTDVAIHLDHASVPELIRTAADCGFTSVMYDGSALPFGQNAANTAEICRQMQCRGISVEGELGVIGRVDEAVRFVEITGVDMLAIGVGTAHGIYKGTPVINIGRIAEIHEAVPCSLVLHGASGLSDEVLKDAVAAGIRKVNFATELRQAFTRGVKVGIKENPDAYDPKIYLPYAVSEIQKTVEAKIRLLKNPT